MWKWSSNISDSSKQGKSSFKENNIPAEVLAVDIKSVDRYIAGSCAYIAITKVTKEYPIPVINGIAFLTGVGQDAEFKN